ncbi:MAG: class I SAM-dependent methyltransferase [Thermoleophilia bacterium]
MEPVYGVSAQEARVEVAGRVLRLHVLDDDALLDALIDEGEEDFDARNPYFGQVWPAAHALAARLAEGGSLAGVHVLDLGCGPGLVGIVAAGLGARVTLADVVPEAVALAAENARLNGETVEAVRLDLRDAAALGTRFDLVVASDVLYERPLAEAVPAAIAALLAPGGRALVADPLRPHREAFERAAAAAGLSVAHEERAAPGPRGPVRVRISTLAR